MAAIAVDMQNQVVNLMAEFRVADRGLFNRYFRLDSPWENKAAAWLLVERFNDLEVVLFQKMVSEALNVDGIRYGEAQRDILVVGQGRGEISALVNREIDSGYWDFPVSIVPADAEMQFVAFFDWDVLSIRDNKYVRVRIASCASNSALAGKHALVDAQEVFYHLRSN